MRREVINMLIAFTYLVVFWVGLYGIGKPDKRSPSFSKSVVIVLCVSAAISVFPHLIAPERSKIVIGWYSIIGNGYMHLLKLFAIPLMLISILPAIYRLKNSVAIGRKSSTNIGDMLLQMKT